ncbi:MAG: redox-sensing transcriptional repressor Rex [Myxococcota bacterium]|jgi:redox-sensing transcriptional repressor|nr:redox-sensing transcriptional repressor Rex [Myxococcota bacterium]
MKPVKIRPRRPELWDEQRISLRTVERLSTYRRVLEDLNGAGVEHVYSHQLAKAVGVTPAQLRRDLSHFGTFGSTARGYNVIALIRAISADLGTDRVQNVVLIGLGNLGRTLLSYNNFEDRGFHIAAVFDIDADKCGKIFAGRRCYHMDELEQVVSGLEATVAILATRRTGVDQLVTRLARLGINGILNFVPKALVSPPGMFIEDVDISSKLEKLSFLAKNVPRDEALPDLQE